jgi:hypothetical protein
MAGNQVTIPRLWVQWATGEAPMNDMKSIRYAKNFLGRRMSPRTDKGRYFRILDDQGRELLKVFARTPRKALATARCDGYLRAFYNVAAFQVAG